MPRAWKLKTPSCEREEIAEVVRLLDLPCNDLFVLMKATL